MTIGADSRFGLVWEPTTVVFLCPHCGKATSYSHPHGAELSHSGNVLNADPLPTKYFMLQCQECSNVVFACRQQVGADSWDEPYFLWPPQDRPLNLSIPESLRRDFDEARSCFRIKAYQAAAVMIRRTVEGVCAEHEVKERDLRTSLETLKRIGVVDGRLHNWMQGIRLLGNQGAHYTKEQVTRQDVEDGLTFVEALLDYAYVLTAKYDEFTARRRRAKTAMSSG